MLRIRAALTKIHRNVQLVGETHRACPAPWPVPPCCSWTPVTSQTRHGNYSRVAVDLSASVHLAQALPTPFSSHIKCNLQGRRVVPATGRSVFAGAPGVVCPVPLGHALSGSFQVQKDIRDAVTTEKNIIFQTTGQINNLSHLLPLLTATGP